MIKLTKTSKKRLVKVCVFFFAVSSFSALLIYAFSKNSVYFYTPSQIIKKEAPIDTFIRVGGMVKKNSLIISEQEIKFIITDLKNELFVSYSGTVPNLFSEGKGVVAEGKLKDKNFFIADRILAKHDEKYMPPELKDLMEKNVK